MWQIVMAQYIHIRLLEQWRGKQLQNHSKEETIRVYWEISLIQVFKMHNINRPMVFRKVPC